MFSYTFYTELEMTNFGMQNLAEVLHFVVILIGTCYHVILWSWNKRIVELMKKKLSIEINYVGIK